MYDSQNIAFLIKKTAKEKGISIKQLLEKCQLNINTISELSKGKQISYLNFATIADNLGISVDYLLGRTEEPKKINYGVETYGDNNGDIHNQVTQESKLDGISKEMLNKFEKLEFNDKVKVMSLIAELSNK